MLGTLPDARRHARRAPRAGALPALILALGVAAAQEGVAPRAETVPPQALAVVNGVAVLRTAVAAQAEATGRPVAELLEEEVERLVLAQHLAARGHDPEQVPAEQVARVSDELRAARPGLELDERLVRCSLAFATWIEAQLDPAAEERYFAEHRLVFGGEVRARHIFLAHEDGVGGATLPARLALVQAELGAEPDEARFTAVARARSEDALAPLDGGDLDWFGGDGVNALGQRLPAHFVRACFERGRPGPIPAPLASSLGLHLLYVTAVRPRETTLDEVRPRVRAAVRFELQRKTHDAWMAEADIRWAADAPRR